MSTLPDGWRQTDLESVALGARASIVSGPFGSNIGKRFFVDEGVPVIRGNNLTDRYRKFVDDGFVFVTPEKAAELRNCLAEPGDLIFTAAGTLGQVGLIPDRPRFPKYVISNKQLRVRLDHEVILPTFAYYWFSSPGMVASVAGQNKGSSVPLITLGILRALPVILPPLHVQRRIASILSAYDDLIENNTRRIQIVEEMAQAIYREWFVEFRFPGHEDVQLVDSELGPVPEGWTVRPLGTVVDVNARTIRKGEEPSEISYIDIASVSEGEFGWTRLEYEVAPGRARRLVAPRDVIWSTVRPNLRAYALVCEPPPICVASTGFAVLTARSVPWSYLYATVTTDSFIGYLVNHATGAAYPAVTGRTFERAPMLVPHERALAAFHDAVGPMHELTAKLHSMSSNLRKTRDLLLPRLISGEIDVSNLDIGDAEPAA